MIDATQLHTLLAQFTGTSVWYRLQRTLVVTQGVKFLCERAECWWLVDVVHSHQLKHEVARESFQCWRITREGQGATITMTNGRTQRVISSQAISYTDFVLPTFTLFASRQQGELVVYLTSEA